MKGLEMLFAVRDGGSISAQDAALVDSALSVVNASEIPDDQVDNVRSYINSALLSNHATIPVEHKVAMERLLVDLEGRE